MWLTFRRKKWRRIITPYDRLARADMAALVAEWRQPAWLALLHLQGSDEILMPAPVLRARHSLAGCAMEST